MSTSISKKFTDYLITATKKSTIGLTEINQAISNPNYILSRVNDRPLEVPDKNLKVAHKLLHLILSDCLPPFQGAHHIQEEVSNNLSNYSSFVRSDISKCFPSVTPTNAIPVIENIVSKSNLDPDSKDYVYKTLPTVFKDGKLSTGSPASPIILQGFLNDFPNFSQSAVYRYVDDILLLGTQSNLETDFNELSSYLDTKGLKLNSTKTSKGDINQGFEFLGYSFGKKQDPSTLIPVNVNAFFPNQNWKPDFYLSFNSSDPTYENRDGGKIVYRADTLIDNINKGSLEALIILASCNTDPTLKKYVKNMSSLISKSFIKPMHGKLYQGYVANVSKPRKEKKKVVAHEADRLLCGLLLSVYIQKHSKLPSNFSKISSEFPEVLDAFKDSISGDNDYHKFIKKLFKQEYQYRINIKKSGIKTNTHVLDLLAESDDLFNDLLNKDLTSTTIDR